MLSGPIPFCDNFILQTCKVGIVLTVKWYFVATPSLRVEPLGASPVLPSAEPAASAS
jgi:hypothetical protein